MPVTMVIYNNTLQNWYANTNLGFVLVQHRQAI